MKETKKKPSSTTTTGKTKKLVQNPKSCWAHVSSYHQLVVVNISISLAQASTGVRCICRDHHKFSTSNCAIAHLNRSHQWGCGGIDLESYKSSISPTSTKIWPKCPSQNLPQFHTFCNLQTDISTVIFHPHWKKHRELAHETHRSDDPIRNQTDHPIRPTRNSLVNPQNIGQTRWPGFFIASLPCMSSCWHHNSVRCDNSLSAVATLQAPHFPYASSSAEKNVST